MKRPLALEALYRSDSFGLHHGEPANIPAMEIAAEHIREIDPHGKRALALLREFGNTDRVTGEGPTKPPA